jgi:hypothetical protein
MTTMPGNHRVTWLACTKALSLEVGPLRVIDSQDIKLDASTTDTYMRSGLELGTPS